nr:MAG TPA: hypothetical protein [Caudoviricetes sp.]
MATSVHAPASSVAAASATLIVNVEAASFTAVEK